MVKKYLLIIFAIIIIVFSFVMPNLLLGVEDISREKEIYARQKKENKKIDVQAEKIYLVTFIHDIFQLKDTNVYYDDKKTVSYSIPVTDVLDVDSPTENFKNEILKLVSNEIVNEINFDEYLDYYEIQNYFPLDYVVHTCSMPKEKNEWIEINIEQKTGKIISVEFSKNFYRDDIPKEKQLQNYAKYLDLDIIGDWEFNDNILKSDKAQLTIMLVEKEDSYMLAITPIEIYEEYVKEEETIKRKYEIVESENKKIKK